MPSPLISTVLRVKPWVGVAAVRESFCEAGGFLDVTVFVLLFWALLLFWGGGGGGMHASGNPGAGGCYTVIHFTDTSSLD